MRDDLDFVLSSLNYLAPHETAPKSYVGRWGSGQPLQQPDKTTEQVAIHDCRPVVDELSLDTNGFVLVRHESRIRDFLDPREVRDAYYPEVERLVEDVTGASCATVFEHRIRGETLSARGEHEAAPPFRYVHNDNTEASGPVRVRSVKGAAEADAWLARRFVILNVWRPIGGPALDVPLAVCDARSIRPDDFVVTELIFPDRTGEVYSLRHHAGHRWYYAREQRPDEVLLFKCYDSATDGRARFGAHSAFTNPDAPSGSRPRESIEVRALAFFAEDR